MTAVVEGMSPALQSFLQADAKATAQAPQVRLERTDSADLQGGLHSVGGSMQAAQSKCA